MCNPLAIFKPEKKSKGEKTSSDSMFYVAFKEPFHIYLEIFDKEDDPEEYSYTTLFNGGDRIITFSGTLRECLLKIKELVPLQ